MSESVRIEPIPTVPGMGRALIHHDPESRNYPARGVLMRPGLERRDRTWRRGLPYDQGSTSSCVGQTGKGMLNTAPFSSQVAYHQRAKYDAFGFYLGAQDNDQWPGREPDYEGTSALGLCRYWQKQGLINEYRWCFGVDDVIDTLVQHGPVGIGVWWYSGMMSAPGGMLTVSGRAVGGHEVELHGVRVKEELVVGTNSWGRGWGDNGRFYMRFSDLDRLLREDGDAFTVTSLK